MCGFVGLVKHDVSKELLEEATNLLSHRGPDDEGFYFGEGIGLGHRRLSIIDLTKAGHQPMSNEDGTIWIVYNGEVYNYIEIRKELYSHKFKSKTDTEVILHAYEEWGKNCLKRFNGMFAFAIWDSKKRELFCARDRIGIKPFYYYFKDSKFIFASEIKALLKVGVPSVPNNRIIYDYLLYGYYDHSDDTFFKGVKQLSPGHYLILRDGKLEIKEYWNLPARVNGVNLSEEECIFKFRELLKSAIELRLRSDVPLGINLSGGLDSSTLLSITNFIVGRDGIETFSAYYDDREYDERSFINELISNMRCSPNYVGLRVEEVFDLANKVLWSLEEPYGGIPTISYWKMHSVPRKRGVVVLLEGQGVDELLGGYEYCYGAFFYELLTSMKLDSFLKEIKDYQRIRNCSLSTIFKIIRSAISTEKKAWTRDASTFLKPHCVSDKFKKKYSHKLSFPKPFKSQLSNMLYRELRYTKIPRVLRFNDRLSMAHSVELRVPFLDHRLVEFAFSLPSAMKIRGGMNKYIMRAAMKEFLPKTILNHPKKQVESPQQKWFKRELKEEISKIINSPTFAERGYFNVEKVKQEFENYCGSKRELNSFFIWQWVNLELWFRMFID